ncbi:4-hydroxy-3-methylbut-2-enyl diphosphate reductase [Streptomyces radicis]|uniref:4-hydroxy-3-methylbut-2-enyl diphosphate reductase n=1 Tax=Streptomyces radicis TaxID=1750517 RepID=A0A3A9WI63_9ACTN|nr:4-hydroxy-3-methylbut-2-enyl diphosphate reductase [Streptomyces radicis]RKN12718.1 4-hydroxy-3-methylbut-2-enyl diphosphate reductase [Streptomyces radicis]RKN27519.1 4-hydroxy-3-methylbut-2-enyl diphosphate reductase [Streptomyces radicis]
MGKVLLAAPRGFCAGVERAIETVERVLERHGPPVYVRRQIVHNTHVVRDLADRGAVFVDELDEVPVGSVVVLSAHGVAPEVHAQAAERELSVVDAVCPLVTKVHREAERFAAEGYQIALVGHAGHEEVTGTVGHAPGRITVVESPEQARALPVADPERVVWLSQTTLAVDEVAETVGALRERLPLLTDPPGDDICYASQNRQDAVRAIAPRCDLLLVVGSANSSNSARLVEVALRAGAGDARLIDDAGQVRDEWFDGVTTVGVSSGASVPEVPVSGLVAALAERGFAEVEEVQVADETLRFALPRRLAAVSPPPRSPAAAAPAAADGPPAAGRPSGDG